MMARSALLAPCDDDHDETMIRYPTQLRKVLARDARAA